MDYVLRNIQTGQFYIRYNGMEFIYAKTGDTSPNKPYDDLPGQINAAKHFTFEDANQTQLLIQNGFNIKLEIINFHDLFLKVNIYY